MLTRINLSNIPIQSCQELSLPCPYMTFLRVINHKQSIHTIGPDEVIVI